MTLTQKQALFVALSKLKATVHSQDWPKPLTADVAEIALESLLPRIAAMEFDGNATTLPAAHGSIESIILGFGMKRAAAELRRGARQMELHR